MHPEMGNVQAFTRRAGGLDHSNVRRQRHWRPRDSQREANTAALPRPTGDPHIRRHIVLAVRLGVYRRHRGLREAGKQRRAQCRIAQIDVAQRLRETRDRTLVHVVVLAVAGVQLIFTDSFSLNWSISA
jgi:hypothetical protein